MTAVSIESPPGLSSSLEYKIPEEYDGTDIKDLPFSVTMEAIKKSASSYFGEEKVDITGNYLIIHFPNVDITNGREHKHTIRDLFVKVRFRQSSLGATYAKPSALSGRRTTMSVAEYDSNYLHSHLESSSSFWLYRSFCRGSGSFGNYFADLGANPFNIFEKEGAKRIEAFWFLLDNYIGWESRAGGPYIYMTNVKRNTSSNISSRSSRTYTQRREYARRILDAMTIEGKTFEYSFTIVKNDINVFIDKEFLLQYTRLTEPYTSSLNNQGVLQETPLPRSHDVDSCIDRFISNITGNSSTIYFKGEVVPVILYDEKKNRVLVRNGERVLSEENTISSSENAILKYPAIDVIKILEDAIRNKIKDYINDKYKNKISNRARSFRTEGETNNPYGSSVSNCSILFD